MSIGLYLVLESLQLSIGMLPRLLDLQPLQSSQHILFSLWLLF